MCLYKRILNMPRVLNMPKLWIWQIYEYGKVFNMRALHSVLNMPEYALTEVWIYLRFYICQDYEYGRALNMQELHRVLNIPQYSWACLNITWICLDMYEFTMIDRALNMSNTIHSARSLYKLISVYWEMDVFRTLSKI